MRPRRFCWKRNGEPLSLRSRGDSLVLILLRSTIPENELADATEKVVELLS